MQKEQSQIERVVGMDMHPDIFTAAVMEGKDAGSAKVGALYDGIATERLEEWAKKHLGPLDLVVLEASGNSFEVVKRLKRVGGGSGGNREPTSGPDTQSLLQYR